MIYDLREKLSLPRLDDLETQQLASGKEYPTFGVLRRICNVLKIVIAIPFIPFITVYYLGKGFLRMPEVVEHAEAKYQRQQDDHVFSFEKVVIEESYDEEAGVLTFRMNYDALKGFATSLSELFGNKHSTPEMRTVGITGSKQVDDSSPGWHTHSDFFFEPLPLEITVGISEGLMLVQEGVGLYAPPELWIKITERWADVADRREEKLIVLDRHQQDWCHPQSTGRFAIEYIPDLLAAEP